LLSPDHSIFAEGALIPAKLLVNGATLTHERQLAAVDYYHIELDRHALLLAEGLLAESYLDTGNRAMFANAGEALILHPEFAVNSALKYWERDACAPLVASGPILAAAKRALLDRALEIGFRVTADPDLHLLAGEKILRPALLSGGRAVFALPAGVPGFWAASRSGAPAELQPDCEDRRRLGIAVSRIVLRNGMDCREIPIDHPSLAEGWHDPERCDGSLYRWSDGAAYVPLASPAEPGTLVELRFFGNPRYWLGQPEQAERRAA
jgi:hypothetical protein